MRGISAALLIVLSLLSLALAQDGVERLTIRGHPQEYYNGVYARGDDWADVAHWAIEDGSAHLYHHPGGYWQLDYRDQDGTEVLDYYDGGYTSGSADYLAELEGDVWWSTGNYLTFSYTDGTEEPLPTPDTFAIAEQIEVSGHVDAAYNGIYYRLEDWNDHAHFALADRSAHLFHLDSGEGYWQLDWRE